MKQGDLVTIAGNTGTVLEVVETETEQRVKLELKDGRIATYIYTRQAVASNALDGMKLA
jgi:molybdopterin-binding protein